MTGGLIQPPMPSVRSRVTVAPGSGAFWVVTTLPLISTAWAAAAPGKSVKAATPIAMRTNRRTLRLSSLNVLHRWGSFKSGGSRSLANTPSGMSDSIRLAHVLLGRGSEVGRIGELLTRAVRDRRSSALIVYGEPGVGKTALLEDVVGRSRKDFRLLLTRPLEAESELGFAGLYDLVRPVQDRLARLPESQRTALAGALALGPPAPRDRFAVA